LLQWRNQFREGGIDWAKPFQIQTYINYQAQNRIPVFIAIGIGGRPKKPEKLFVTPLCNI
jgi:hypothetical protein